MPQQSTGGVTQAADASLAQASQQSSTGSVAGAPGSAEALRASQGIVRGADIRTSTTSEAAARVSQPGAQAGHNSQMAASDVMGAAGEGGRALQQSSTGSAAAALGSAEALRASQGSAPGVHAMFAPPASSAAPEALSESGRVSQQSAGGVAQAADASLARASQQSSTGSMAGASRSGAIGTFSIACLSGARGPPAHSDHPPHKVTDHGRWRAPKAMRRYITTALQDWASDTMPHEVRHNCCESAKRLWQLKW